MSSNESPLAFLTKKPFWYFIMMWVSLKVWLIIGAGIQAVVDYYQTAAKPSEGWSIVTYTVAFALAMIYIFVLYPRRPGFVMWLSVGISVVADAWFTYWVVTSVHQHGLGLSANLVPYLGWLDVFCRSIVGPMTGAMLVLFTLLNIWLVFAILQPEKYGLEWLSIRLLPEHDTFVFTTEEYVDRIRNRPRNRFFRGVYLLSWPFMQEFRSDPSMTRKPGASEKSWFVGVDSTDFEPKGAPSDGIDCFLFPGSSRRTYAVGDVELPNPPIPDGLVPEVRAQLAFINERAITNVLETQKETREAFEEMMKKLSMLFGALGMLQITAVCRLMGLYGEIDRIQLDTDLNNCTLQVHPELVELAMQLDVYIMAVDQVISELERRLRAAGRLVTIVKIQDCDFVNEEVRTAMTELAKAANYAMAAPGLADAHAQVVQRQLDAAFTAINAGLDPAKQLDAKGRAEIAKWFFVGQGGGMIPFLNLGKGVGVSAAAKKATS